MCDFHSILGVANGADIRIFHLPSNSHSDMTEKLGIRNLPQRKCVVFEAEWSGSGAIPADNRLIRNFSECPEALVKKIRTHYEKLKEALDSGKHFESYFSDATIWLDVWEKAMAAGRSVDFSRLVSFPGTIIVPKGASFDAPKLSEVSGSVYVQKGASFKAPALVKSGYVDVREGASFDAPKLSEVSGSVYVQKGASFDAPKLPKNKVTRY